VKVLPEDESSAKPGGFPANESFAGSEMPTNRILALSDPLRFDSRQLRVPKMDI